MNTQTNNSESSVLFDQPGPRGRRMIRIFNSVAAVLIIALVVAVLARLHNPPQGENQLSWELWKPAFDYEAWSDFYLPGLWMTLKAAIVAIIGSIVFGVVFGIGRLVPSRLVRAVSAVIVEFFRAVPELLLMVFFWRWFAFAGVSSPSYWAVVGGLVLYTGSVVAELVRSGVGNLPHGQREAAVALGLSPMQSLMTVEVPQALYAMLPATITQLVVVLKDTALGSIIMYTDLLQESRRLGAMYFNILQTLVVAGVIYFILDWLLSRLAERMPAVMQRRTWGNTVAEPTAPIAIMDATNANQIAAAHEPMPFGGAERRFHDHYHGSNATTDHWQHAHYSHGHDLQHPEVRARNWDEPLRDFARPFQTKPKNPAAGKNPGVGQDSDAGQTPGTE